MNHFFLYGDVYIVEAYRRLEVKAGFEMSSTDGWAEISCSKKKKTQPVLDCEHKNKIKIIIIIMFPLVCTIWPPGAV